LALDVDTDRPNESQHLSGYRGNYLLLGFAFAGQSPIAVMQSVLRFPSDSLHLFAQALLANAKRFAHRRSMP
jgi:hypothetical protein